MFIKSISKIFTLLLLLSSSMSQACSVSVAVASNFTLPMQKISESFETETGCKTLLSFGSTGSFYAQIKNGAPYQLFLSADDETTQLLEKEGFSLKGSSFTYAIGKLVLWSHKINFVDNSSDILNSKKFNKIAIADPKIAPYGLAAMQTLKKLGLFSTLEPKIIQGENITQTYQFVLTKNADLGFVALSQVFDNGKIKSGSSWIVPSSFHNPIIQNATLLNPGKDQEGTLMLVNYLKSDKAKTIIRSFGYDVQ